MKDANKKIAVVNVTTHGVRDQTESKIKSVAMVTIYIDDEPSNLLMDNTVITVAAQEIGSTTYPNYKKSYIKIMDGSFCWEGEAEELIKALRNGGKHENLTGK